METSHKQGQGDTTNESLQYLRMMMDLTAERNKKQFIPLQAC